MHITVLAIYLLESLILGITAYTVGMKYSAYPDCSVGYQWKSAEQNADTWRYANRAASITCGAAAVFLLAAGLLLWFVKPGKAVSIVLLLLLSAAALGAALLVPHFLLKRKRCALYKDSGNMVE